MMGRLGETVVVVVVDGFAAAAAAASAALATQLVRTAKRLVGGHRRDADEKVAVVVVGVARHLEHRVAHLRPARAAHAGGVNGAGAARGASR